MTTTLFVIELGANTARRAFSPRIRSSIDVTTSLKTESRIGLKTCVAKNEDLGIISIIRFNRSHNCFACGSFFHQPSSRTSKFISGHRRESSSILGVIFEAPLDVEYSV